MNVWKLRAGDTGTGRNYADLCIANGIALAGLPDLKPLQDRIEGVIGPFASEEDALDDYFTCVPGATRFTKRFLKEVRQGDHVILVHGSTVHAVGVVQSSSHVPIADMLALGFDDIDGWELVLGWPVDWRVPLSGEIVTQTFGDEPGFSNDRFSMASGKHEACEAISKAENTGWLRAIESDDSGLAFASRTWELTRKDLEVSQEAIRARPSGYELPTELRRRTEYYYLESSQSREHEVVTHLVVPLLESLSWEAPRQIRIEGGFVDIVLFNGDDRAPENAAVYIEAKRFWSSTTGSRDQAVSYANRDRLNPGSPVVTTTGGRWAVWSRDGEGANAKVFLTAYANLLDSPQPLTHPLLQYLAKPGTTVGGLDDVIRAISPSTFPIEA